LSKFATGDLRVPIDSTFPLEEATKAHERMRENKNIGKIFITIKDSS
jgi:NADPH2:quinone reductase